MSKFQIATGNVSARMHGAEQELRQRARAAHEAAHDCEPYAAAALRGKARGYIEAAELLSALDQGRRIPKRRRWTHWEPPVRTNRRSVALGDTEEPEGAQFTTDGLPCIDLECPVARHEHGHPHTKLNGSDETEGDAHE